MRPRHLAFAALAGVGIWLFAASCSNPLETTPVPSPPEPFESIDTLTLIDTVVVADSTCDTLFVTDTIVVTDTVRWVDTVWVTDTVIAVDTLVIEVPDSTECASFCAEIGYRKPYAVWQLDNEPGRYRLELTAWTDGGDPLPNLVVSVNRQEYSWSPASQGDLSLDVQLGADAKVKVWVGSLAACDYSVTVCLKVTPL
jgi:hypothetical protein